MIILPGVRSNRTDRRSGNVFYWRARDATLTALTGQAGVLTTATPTTEVGGAITPAIGTALIAGRAQPRWSVDGTALTLALSGVTAGQLVERLVYPFSLSAIDLTVLMRLRGLWTAGASMSGGVLSLGFSSGGAGALRIIKTTTNWQIIITTGFGTTSVNLAENAGLVWPVDVLMTHSRATGLTALTLRGANGTLYGPVSMGSLSYVTAGRWGGEQIGLGYNPITAMESVPMKVYFVKIAPGVLTYAQMDVLE